jgi:FkbM family methyltransferase
MKKAYEIAQSAVKLVPPLYNKIHAVQLARWTADDEKRLLFYGQFIKAGSLCFDIGANFGNRVKVFLRLGAKVVAVEPQPECIKTLRTVYGRRQDLVLVDKAVGAQEGKSEIFVPQVTGAATMSTDWIRAVTSSGRFAHFNWKKKRWVEVITLEQLIKVHCQPDFIKIDVEGFEYEVIQTLRQPVQMLSFEYHSEYIDSTMSCLDHLTALGDYEFNYCAGEDTIFALSRWVRSSQIKALMGAWKGLEWGDVYARNRIAVSTT